MIVPTEPPQYAGRGMLEKADQWMRPPAGAGYDPAVAAVQKADHTVDLAGFHECESHDGETHDSQTRDGETRDGVTRDGETRDGETRRLLVGQTARFAASFVRWMEGRTCDGLSY